MLALLEHEAQGFDPTLRAPQAQRLAQSYDAQHDGAQGDDHFGTLMRWHAAGRTSSPRHAM